MSITLTSAFLAELKKNVNVPNVIIEVGLDSGAVKWGTDTGGFTDVLPIVKSVSSLQNKLDPKGFSTRGQLTVVITGRDNFKSLIANNYLKNRRVTRKDGFIASGFAYSDYAATFTGRISDWSRKGDELTITVSDDLIDAGKKIPVENASKTQYVSLRNMHPADIMTNILLTQLGINSAYVDSTTFASERDTWLAGWKFDRVITEPKEANEYLNELQIESNSFLFHDGQKVTYKVFAPPVPSIPVDEWTDNAHILSGSFSQKSGYKEGLFNRIVVYYDYDESGDDKETAFESAVIAVDAASQGAGQWNEVLTKTIKSKWIRSFTYTEPSTLTGVVIYHVSSSNGAGTGTLTYNAGNKTIQWSPPGTGIGSAVDVSKDGKYQVFGADGKKYVRVIVTTASLPVGNTVENIAITALNTGTMVTTLTQKLLSRYRNPAATVSMDVDINSSATGATFMKPSDIKDVTTDEACEKGETSWNKERLMLTSVRPDFATGKVSVEAVETKMYRRYGFIAPAGLPDYPLASVDQRRYGFIGDVNNKVNAGVEDGFYIW